MNEQGRLSYLLARYVNNECSAQEFDELAECMGREVNAELTQALKEIWEQTEDKPAKTDVEWQEFYTAMMSSSIKNKKIKFSTWQKIAVAALFILVGATALMVYQYAAPANTVAVNKLKNAQELSPGGNKAILTLADGKKIILDGINNGTVANQTGISITKTSDGQLVYTISAVKAAETAVLKYNTIEVPRGGQYQITMPDGTRVWLNSMSSLKYPLHFSATERKVELTGEGYFEVAKSPKVPFRVKTTNQVIEVTGTHFNVNAYQNETATRTTLLEGGVKVLSTDGAKKIILTPGQQSELTSAGFIVKAVDTERATAWKNGNFMFSNDDIGSIMRQISRWYDVDIVYQNNAAKARFSGNISRFEHAAQVLEILELTGLVHFKIEGRRIIVM